MGEKVDLHIGGYHLTETIGVGGMGSVFRAVVEADDKPVPKGTAVAVKLLHPHLRSVQEFVKRFHREARLAATIDHPNVVRVLDEGIHVEGGIHEKRHHYIVMELAEGIKLSELISDHQPLSPQQTIEVMNQVCEALKAAAAIEDPEQPGRVRSLVHRDIKPDNIIIQPLDRAQFDTMTRTGDKTALANIRAKLLDFGLAKDVRALSTVLSQTGQSLGTPAYMSPEQCKGEDVDPRSDIYSLGVVAYHMITGTQPFPGPTTVAYARQHAEEIPPDILQRNPLCPKSLADCIYRCLAKDPKDRYASPGELQADLARVAQGRSVATVYRFRKKGSFSTRKVAAIVACTLLAAAVAAVGGWHYMTDRTKTTLVQAIQKADVAIAAQDYAAARQILEAAIAAVPDRPDRASLVAPAHQRLLEIAAKARQQEEALAQAEAERQRRTQEAADAAARARHEQDAIAAVADIKARTAAGRYQEAIDAANEAIRKFSDTPSGKDLPDLLAAATEKLAAEQREQAAREAAEQQRQAAERAAVEQRQAAEVQARRERFVKYRDEGDAAFNAVPPNYAAARQAYEKALAELPDDQVKARLDTCIERTTRQPVAVIDFDEKGDVASALGVRDAGQTVAELVLTRFGQDRYQLIERTQLAKILKEIDLTITVVRDNPERVYGKLKGVKYLVLGRVSRLGNIIVTARMVDVATGNVMQTAEVSAEDARGLQGALTELVRILQMSDAEKKAYKPTLREFPKEFTNSVGMKMVLIPAGEFWMGSKLSPPEVVARYGGNEDLCQDEQPRHRVRITQSFYLAACEVTVGQFRQFADATGYQTDAEKEGWSYGWKDGKWDTQQGLNWRAPGFQQNFDHPVVCVSWNDAKAFCEWLGRQEGKSYRLPTEAEWEYACRAGSDTEFWWGDEMDTTGRVANVGDSKHWNPAPGFKIMQMDDGYQFTAPVANYRANGFGLYDMIGNAWEWCQDWYGGDYYSRSPGEDPPGAASGQYRVLRGGSWNRGAIDCRSAYRDGGTPGSRRNACGFRVASGTP